LTTQQQQPPAKGKAHTAREELLHTFFNSSD
jgi:hypothetical protein